MRITEINILGKGVNLSGIGINAYAYSCEYIDDVLYEIQRLGFIILGGDVYTESSDELVLTYDNWYYRLTNTSLDSWQSLEKAKDFIASYITNNGKNYYFSFVLKMP